MLCQRKPWVLFTTICLLKLPVASQIMNYQTEYFEHSSTREQDTKYWNKLDQVMDLGITKILGALTLSETKNQGVWWLPQILKKKKKKKFKGSTITLGKHVSGENITMCWRSHIQNQGKLLQLWLYLPFWLYCESSSNLHVFFLLNTTSLDVWGNIARLWRHNSHSRAILRHSFALSTNFAHSHDMCEK